MDLDYDEIMRIYRLEKNSAKPVAVEETFFDDMAVFFKKEKADYLKSLHDLTSTKAKSFSNLKKIMEQIFSLREKKLLNKALVASRTGELENGQLALQERETLKQLLKVLNKHQQFFDEIVALDNAKQSSTKSEVELKLLQAVPAFVGSDMQEYGPFEKGGIEKVPVKIADLLIARKLAEKNK